MAIERWAARERRKGKGETAIPPFFALFGRGIALRMCYAHFSRGHLSLQNADPPVFKGQDTRKCKMRNSVAVSLLTVNYQLLTVVRFAFAEGGNVVAAGATVIAETARAVAGGIYKNITAGGRIAMAQTG
jgi:hypothetical protein